LKSPLSWRAMSQRLCLLVLFVHSWLGVDIIVAQAPSRPADLQPDYSQEPFVIEHDSAEIAFENDGNSVRKSRARVRIQSDAGVQRYAVLKLAYQSSTESVDIDYVRVRKPDATLVLTPSENVQDSASEITRQAPSYSDLREKDVTVKGLGVGDVIEYEAHWNTTKPLVPGQFWFSYTFPRDGINLRQTLQISVPLERLVKWRSPKSNPTITQTDTRRMLTWTTSQLERKSKEQEQKDQETLICQTGRGKLPQPEVQLSSFQSWEEVGRWHESLQEERAKPTAEIRAKAAELTKSLADDRAKAQAIYNYVSKQVHYIGINFGIGRYQPYSAAEVLGNQYGDCKDKHTLLAALLGSAGIQAVPALISVLHDFDPELPSPGQFDHVISAVRVADELIWLDTTAEVARFAYLVGPLRNKKALLISRDKPPALVTTPAGPPFEPVQTFRIDAKLGDTGTLQGKIERTVQGDDSEVLLRAAFRRVPIAQWKELIQQLSYASGFAGEVGDVTASSPENTDEPFHFGYSYMRKDYPDWTNRRVSSPLPPMVLPSLPEKDEKPVNPLWLGAPAEVRSESHVELPKGYRPVLPKNLDVNDSFAEYHRSFAFKDGILTTQRRLVVRLGEVPVDDYEAYRKFAKAFGDEFGLTVPLSSGPSSPTSYQNEIWDLPYSENADAVRAYDDAREKSTKNDLQGEIASLRRALEADPKFTRAWLWLGEIYKFNRQPSEALQAYNKAINVDPQQAVGYKALGYTLLSMQKPEDAIPIWQQLIKVAPSDYAGPEGLGSSLLILKRYAEAESALETAAAMDPESPGVRVQLGTACLRAGDDAKALSAYQKAIELVQSPPIFNTVPTNWLRRTKTWRLHWNTPREP
jgi:tetratricopeptide (TPR) repeat protein